MSFLQEILGTATQEDKARPSPAFVDFMEKTIKEMAEGMYMTQSRLVQPLVGYRPMCALCRRPVDDFRWEERRERRSIRVIAQCHSKWQQFEIDEYALNGYKEQRSIIDIIEGIGFFRDDAARAEKDRAELQYLRDENGNIEEVSFKKPPSWIIDDLDDGLKFDDTEYRRIIDKMTAQQRASAMANIGGNYTAAGSSAPTPRKPTKAELLKMLAEYEKQERPEIALDAERAITL